MHIELTNNCLEWLGHCTYLSQRQVVRENFGHRTTFSRPINNLFYGFRHFLVYTNYSINLEVVTCAFKVSPQRKKCRFPVPRPTKHEESEYAIGLHCSALVQEVPLNFCCCFNIGFLAVVLFGVNSLLYLLRSIQP